MPIRKLRIQKNRQAATGGAGMPRGGRIYTGRRGPQAGRPAPGPVAGAVFLDRDGVVNACPTHRYITSWKEFRFLPGVLKALRTLALHGERVLIVSNQSGVGRGLLQDSQLRLITRRMAAAIRRAGGKVQSVLYCVHRAEEGCGCRKPRIGMLLRAARRCTIDLKKSFVVGDQETDILMGRSAGCRTILVLSGKHTRRSAKELTVLPDRISGNLEEAVHWILKQE